IAIDNTINKTGLCRVYNDAAAKAKYPYLCFAHEDILFHTNNWGRLMVETLSKPEHGMLGICGGKYYPNVPGGWLDIPHDLRRFSMLTQKKGVEHLNSVKDSTDSFYSYTVTLDGLLMAMRRDVWEHYRFGEDILKNFDFYDIELCIRLQQKYKLVIDHRIVVEHFGVGRYVNKKWIREALHYYDYRKVKGAASVGKYNNSYLEDFAFKRFVERVVAIDDKPWKRMVFMKLLKRFPGLFVKNLKFISDISCK
ncbi:MAG TPA: glycosyltransferase, partial [Chitinophagales bacterium]|nr:glycosyltransferase [Chitinophagales bacterium]